MAFPKLAQPSHMIKQESTGKEFRFRPYLVREEKLLMAAKESKQVKDIFQSIQTIVKSCCLEKKFNVEALPIFDLETFFLRLRAISVNNIETIIITDAEDKQDYYSKIDFNEIKVQFPKESISPLIKVNNEITIQMKYPSASIYEDSNAEIMLKLTNGQIFDLVVGCIDKIFNKDVLMQFTGEELREFLDGLDVPTYKKMKDFLLNMPKLEHRVEYKNNLGHDRFVLFTSIVDFFFFL